MEQVLNTKAKSKIMIQTVSASIHHSTDQLPGWTLNSLVVAMQANSFPFPGRQILTLWVGDRPEYRLKVSGFDEPGIRANILQIAHLKIDDILICISKLKSNLWSSRW